MVKRLDVGKVLPGTTRRRFLTAAAAGLAGAVRPAPAAERQPTDGVTLDGKVLAGYQGWFRTPGDGAGRGWVHYGGRGGRFEPGNCSIDLWPDVAELDDDEKYPTDFRHADGSLAHVFSSHNAKTVARHFRWMANYGIDGAFVQRFGTELRAPQLAPGLDNVLEYCRAAAAAHRRQWALMYDLSGLRLGQIGALHDDWQTLMHDRRIAADDMYLRLQGRPLVAVWGVGFDDGRQYTLEECAQLVRFLKSERGGRCAVMLGVPFWWRTLRRDAVADPALHELLRQADVIAPWSVGRYRDVQEVQRTVRQHWAEDMAWCREAGVEYLPAAFPGFSWHNLKKMLGQQAPLDQIPRRGGEFFWSQFVAARQAGATSVYVAMFDEIDEGTAIFKCTNDPPVGDSPFLTYENLPPDHYLRLAGHGGRLLRGELEEPS